MSSLNNSPIKDLKTSVSLSVDRKTIRSFHSSDSPTISIFPKKLLFPQIYPHGIQQKKLLIPNSGIDAVDFKLYIADPSPFSVPVTDITIAPGETYALLVSFNPKELGLFNTSLIFRGNTDFFIPLTGKCVPSPLEIPSPSSKVWTFSQTNLERTIEFKNRDLSKSLTVVTASDSQAFSIYPMQFEIASASSANVVVTYHPEKEGAANPTLTVQCAESGDSFRIPLLIVPPKATVPVDFGICCAGEILSHDLHISNTDVKPQNIPEPFSLKSFNPTKNSMVLSFSPKVPGKYSAKIELSDVIIDLKATAIEFPISVKVTSQFPKEPFILRNTTNDDIVATLKADGFNLSRENLILKPGESYEISAVKNSNESPTGNMIISWETKNGRISSRINLLEAMDKENVGSINVQPNFILFSSLSQKEHVVVSSTSDFLVKSPEYIDSQKISDDTVEIRPKTEKESIDLLTFSIKGAKTSIPVISSTVPLKIDLPSNLELVSIADNHKEAYKNSFSLTNTGETTIFVAFSSNNEEKVTIFIDPYTCILKPKEKKSFDVASDGPGSINVYYGSEFLRSILCFVNQKNFFAKLFEPTLIKKFEYNVAKQPFTKFFKSTLQSAFLKLETKQKKSNLITMSPQLISFDVDEMDETKIANIINMSQSPFSYSVIASSPFIIVEPLSGKIDAYSSVNIKISVLKRINGYISVKCGDNVCKMKVRASDDLNDIDFSTESAHDTKTIATFNDSSIINESINKKEKLTINSTRIHFNRCAVGTLRRALLKVTNKTHDEVSFTAQTELPFSTPIVEFTVESKSFVYFPIHFLPLESGKYSSVLNLTSDVNQEFNIDLRGTCVDQ